MKCNAAARSKARRQDETGFSLFPFLAVLICTMGVLILLLIVIARQARAQATQEAQSKTTEEQKGFKEAREDAQWWIDNLQKSLEEQRSRLAAARLELGHLEDNARQIRGQLAAMEQTRQQLDSRQADPGERRAIEERLGQLRTELVEAERQLVETRREARERRGSYAIMPYVGPNGTHRRPIYVECTARTIVIQPEGVVLLAGDFEGPLGADSPMAAALRAAREYLLRRGAVDGGKSEEPYPLLLVRPSGIVAYYAAREAMESWGPDFGYEMIGDDWKLDFPPADPQLAETLRREIDLARQRQQRLVEAAPSHYQNYRGAGGRPQYTVSNGPGGVVPYGNTSEPDSPGPAFGGPRSSGPFGEGKGGGATPSGRGDAGLDGGAQSGAGRREGSRLGLPDATSKTASGPEMTGGAATAGAAASGPKSSSAPGGATLGPGEWRPSAPSGPKGDVNSTSSPPANHASPLARRRGPDWALPDASPRSTPLVRPIRIECHPDRLVVAAQPGGAGGRTIPLGERTDAATDDFVSAVWSHMETWGIAGNHMYWRPTLNVYVAPGAEQRFADLDALLKDSGLQVEKKGFRD
jgi:hypothetical protein